jgi:hypothetical protein
VEDADRESVEVVELVEWCQRARTSRVRLVPSRLASTFYCRSNTIQLGVPFKLRSTGWLQGERQRRLGVPCPLRLRSRKGEGREEAPIAS